jgi:hypothetical protein
MNGAYREIRLNRFINWFLISKEKATHFRLLLIQLFFVDVFIYSGSFSLLCEEFIFFDL